MNGKHFDVKDMEREYKRGRVEELKELHNKMCFKHFDSKSMNPERLIESSIIIGLVGFGITIYSIALGIKLCDLQKELK